ncbi:Ldh family oxidoreductase [Paenibacillus chartarius]|uniref:Ldh family oxidoreductase n=1 Tax=Paenibacillus chartarius TaxID=747481 RepID=A0ABV6DGW3_9BACL
MGNRTIRIDELKEQAVHILISKGAAADEAEAIVADYLDAELRGRTSHGFISFAVAIASIEKRGRYEVETLEDSFIKIQGNGDNGHIVARKAIDLAAEQLPNQKVIAIGIRDITRFNCPGVIARYGAERGKIALVWEYGGKNYMIPHGGKEAVVGTNPLGIGIPHTDPLFVIDIALSERAIGFVELAKLRQEPIPETWGVDKEGRPTTDPHQLAAVNPLGGYKGFALALAFEILSGALVQVPIGKAGSVSSRGALILLIDPTIFGHSTDSFREQVTSYLQEVVASPAIDPNYPVSYPGQSSEARARELLERGEIQLPGPVIERLSSWYEEARRSSVSE